MIEAYRVALEAPREEIHREVFNVGYENLSVGEIAELVQEEVGDPEVKITVQPTNDHRSYHINSDKIKRVLGFKPRYTIAEAIRSICEAYHGGLIPDPLTDPRYYNVKTMQVRGLK